MSFLEWISPFTTHIMYIPALLSLRAFHIQNKSRVYFFVFKVMRGFCLTPFDSFFLGTLPDVVIIFSIPL